MFLGGFDNSDASALNSAWIARGEWTVWPALGVSQPDAPLVQLTWPRTGEAWSLESSPDLRNWQPAGGFPATSPTATTQSIDPSVVPRNYFRLRRDGF